MSPRPGPPHGLMRNRFGRSESIFLIVMMNDENEDDEALMKEMR